jgi:hypothetical protein
MGYKYVAPRIEGYAFLGFLGVCYSSRREQFRREQFRATVAASLKLFLRALLSPV